MKTLLSITLLSLSVGAWGQTTKPCPKNNNSIVHNSGQIDGLVIDDVHVDNCAKVIDNSGQIKNAVVLQSPVAFPTCTCTFSADGKSMSCAPAKVCVKFIHSDEDVPAIQEDYKLYVESTNCRVAPECKNSKDPMCNIAICDNVNHTEKRWTWTCADKSRTLMETLDGKTHYCHKPQLTER